MQAVGVILTLITIGTILGPIGAVVIIYREDLTQLVIPPELNNLIKNNGDNNNNNGFNPNDNNGFNPNDNSNNYNVSVDNGFSDLFNPRFISAEIDKETGTCTINFELTNSMDYPVTLNALDANIAVTQDMYPAGTITLTNPVTIPSKQTTLVIVTGYWTQDAKNYINNNYSEATSVELYSTNMTVNANGMSIQITEIINLGSIPVNVQR
jgi:hypothetical protein